MKTIPPPCPEPETGPKYWRSLDHLADTPEFRAWVEREFPAGASELTDPVTRRNFVKIMSASFLLAGFGLTGCRQPQHHIYPFGKMPEGYTHGLPAYYATAMPQRGGAIPLIVEAHEGRPTKVEGNFDHPDSNGGTDAYAQASVLDLYDPDRATRYVRRGTETTRQAAEEMFSSLAEKFSGSGGQGLAILSGRSTSPSRARLRNQIQEKYPNASWHVYEPVDFDAQQEAARVAFGKPLVPYAKLSQARVIVSLDSDLLGTEADSFRHVKEFANGRRLSGPGDEMNRLYVVEGLLSLTGANADHRLRVPASEVGVLAAQLAGEVIALAGQDVGNAFSDAVKQYGGGEPRHEQWVKECAKDLLANRGECLVVAGYRQPVEVHLLAMAMNVALGNVGTTLLYHPAPEPDAGSLSELVKQLNSDAVDTLVVLDGNPVFNAPVDLDWGKAQRRANVVIRYGYYEDATSALSQWHIPATHYLESWGDARSSDGTVVAVQPLISPLFGGMTELELLARLAGEEVTDPYEIVRSTLEELGGEEASWKNFLHDGYLPGTAAQGEKVVFDVSKAAERIGREQPYSAPGKENIEVVFYRDSSLDDGRYVNNGWLQELPDPITKITWDNPILLSRRTAAEWGVKNGRVIEVEVHGRKARGPVFIVPGYADFTLGLALGYGNDQTGRVGRNVGFDFYKIRTSNAPYFAQGAKVTLTGADYPLACTQDHHVMEGRPIIREANLEQYRAHPNFANNMGLEAHAPDAGPLYQHPYQTYEEQDKEGKSSGGREQVLHSKVHQWGMTIDLTACVGCSACVLACQSENNIPIVGKQQVAMSREMHWLRIDRYFSTYEDKVKTSDPDYLKDPQMITQPMLCQHCEWAPCETVCPVNATVHDEEGLNLMAYNRCVGTRYCSNNCPYKVRRFNFFDYNKRPLKELYLGPLAKRPEDEWTLLKMVRQPDVSVRMRGVMEKCTFCVQRIEKAKIQQKVKAGASNEVAVPEGSFTTACAQACPAEAIVFGNLLDKESRVSQLKRQQRDYKVLGYLATQPRVTYLARIRNPNMSMPDYLKAAKELEAHGHEAMPASTAEYAEKMHSNPFQEGHGHGNGHSPGKGSSGNGGGHR